MPAFVSYIETLVSGDCQNAVTRNAVASLLLSLRKHDQKEVSEESLRTWIAGMMLANLKKSTRKKYFSRIYTIYREWKTSVGDDPFAAVKDVVNLDPESGLIRASENLVIARRLLGLRHDSPEWMPVAAFFYLLYDVSASVSDAVCLRFDDDVVDCPQVDNLVEAVRRVNPERKYVFRHSSGRLSDAQAAGLLVSEIHAALRCRGMLFGESFSRGDITAVWIAAAVAAGVSYAEIRSLLPSLPAGFGALGIIPPAPLTERGKTAVIRRVADCIDDKTSRWFVMRMRQGQTPESVKQRIEEDADDQWKNMMFYYPVRKVSLPGPDKRMVSKEVPYIPGILFFKTVRNNVAPLFGRIGDLAWCYRYSNTAGSGYCSISPAEMKAFQKNIGVLSPDVEMELVVRQQPLEEGTEVRISGGGRMVGEKAVVESSRNVDGSRTYTLRLTDFLQARWTIEGISEIYLDPLK